MTKVAEKKKSLRRVLTGNVIKLSDLFTVKVRVETKFPHPKYGKIIKTHKNYLVSKNNSEVEVGDIVNIGEIKPISKNKTWEITEVIKKAN